MASDTELGLSPGAGRLMLTMSSESRKGMHRSGHHLLDTDEGPGPEAEFAAVHGLEMEQSPQKAGDSLFLVSAAWYSEWKVYVQYDVRHRLALDARHAASSSAASSSGSSDTPLFLEAPRPGPIDNSDLIVDGKLKPCMIDGVNYLLLYPAVWKKLVSLYGGGPCLERQLIEVGPSKVLQTEIYPLELLVEVRSSKQPSFSFSISKEATGVYFLNRLASRLFVAPHRMRLWHSNGRACNLLIRQNLTSSLDDLRVSTGDTIFVQLRCPDDAFWEVDEPKTTFVPGAPSWFGLSVFGSAVGGPFAPEARYEDSREPPIQVGVCGFINLGNTCFMNSALQCLSNAPPLSAFFLEPARWEAQLNKDSVFGTGGKLAEEFAKLMVKIWTANISYTPPTDFKWTVGKFAPQFAGYRQHDAQELLAFVLDALHEDLNRVLAKRPVEKLEVNELDVDDGVIAQESWCRYLLREQSIVVDTFAGQFKSTVKCPECPRVSVTFDPFLFLQVPLPGADNRAMQLLFFPREAPPVHCKVVVKKNGTANDLLVELARLFPNAALPGLEIYSTVRSYIQTQIKPQVSLDIVDRTVLNVYATTDAAAAGKQALYTLVFLLRKQRDNVKFLVGEPFVLKLAAKDVEIAELYKLAHRQLVHVVVFGDEAAAGEASGEAASSSSKKSGRKKSSRRDYPFDLCAVNEKGSMCASDTCPDAACTGCSLLELARRKDLNLTSPFYLAVDFKGPVTLRNPVVHESMDAVPMVAAPAAATTDSGGDGSTSKRKVRRTPSLELAQCLALHCQEERLTEDNAWYCSVCKKHLQASKKLDLYRLPDVLVVQLKRFYYTANVREKIESFVGYPLGDWDLSAYEQSRVPGRPPPVYDLIGVVNHFGGLGGGHYTAYCKNKVDGCWYDFNDKHTALIEDPADVVTPAAYLLFYRRRGSPEEPRQQHPE